MFNANYFNRFNESETYAAGEVIFNEGDQGNLIYAIQLGEVQVVHNGEVLATLGEGELFGEMALIDSMPRSATVIALTDVRLVPVDQAHFYAMLQKTPVFGTTVMQVISNRLRHASGLTEKTPFVFQPSELR
jgi:CRP-like cAMP-binding protein